MPTVFAFLAILPIGEHFHIVTALPDVFFGRDVPANRVPSVDLEPLGEDDVDPDTLPIGAQTALDLTWKEGLDAFTCTECGRCKDACPTFLTGKPLSLKWVNDAVKHHLLERRRRIRANDATRLPPLVGGTISEDTLWACTTCGYCEVACPIGLEHLPKFYPPAAAPGDDGRRVPARAEPRVRRLRVTGNPWGLDAGTRGDWAKDLGVPVCRSAEEVAELDYLYYVGSASSFDPRGQKIARAFVRVAAAAGIRSGSSAPLEGSTGECVRRLGNEMVFQQLAGALVETLNRLGVKRIVTTDPHAFNALKNEFGEFGGHYEVMHHTQAIDAWMRDGPPEGRSDARAVIYHEPCYLGRHNGEYEAPRRVLFAVSRDAPLEFELSREKAMCCGAGGGRMWLEETIGTRINVLRAEQAMAQHPRGGDGMPLLRGDARRRPRTEGRARSRTRHRGTGRRGAAAAIRDGVAAELTPAAGGRRTPRNRPAHAAATASRSPQLANHPVKFVSGKRAHRLRANVAGRRQAHAERGHRRVIGRVEDHHDVARTHRPVDVLHGHSELLGLFLHRIGTLGRVLDVFCALIGEVGQHDVSRHLCLLLSGVRSTRWQRRRSHARPPAALATASLAVAAC